LVFRSIRGDIARRRNPREFIARGIASRDALFEIDDDQPVTILAVRHRRASDYH
jgi:hypothetical protein